MIKSNSCLAFKRILVFTHGELVGDGMIRLPFVRALGFYFPNAKVTWFSNKRFSGDQPSTVFNGDLAPMVEGKIHEVIECQGFGQSLNHLWSKPWLPYLFPNSNKIEKFDLIIDTEKKVLSTLCLKRIPHKLFISATHRGVFSSNRKIIINKPDLLINRLLKFIGDVTGNNITTETISLLYDTEIPQPWLDKAQYLLGDLIKQNKKIVLLSPGAGGRFKCWPLTNFIELAKQLAGNGLEPCFILGPAEQEWSDVIKQAIPNAFFPLSGNATPSPYLTMALAKVANISVANDSGVGHILAAANQPIISLWGPTEPKKSTPNGRKVTVIRAQDFGGNAMVDIPVDAVLNSILKLI